MPVVDIGRYEDTFVVYFGSELPSINAYTLASTIVGIADAAKAANTAINPGHELEVVVEALGPGSFKATLRAISRGADNVFSVESAKAVVLSVVAAFIYQHTLGPDSEVTVKVGESEVVITQGDTQIVAPRHVHRALEEVEHSPQFRKGITDAVRAVETDQDVTSGTVRRTC